MRKPEDVPEEVAFTVKAIIEVSGKSIKTMYYGLSLLKLPEEIRMAILPDYVKSVPIVVDNCEM